MLDTACKNYTMRSIYSNQCFIVLAVLYCIRQSCM